MITIEPCIRKIKSNGRAQVYIRIIQNQNPAYISTSFTVHQDQVVKNKINDFAIIVEIAPIIKDYYEKLNKQNTSSWTVQEVVQYLKSENDEISFSKFYEDYVRKMIQEGRENSADNYTSALNSLLKFTSEKNLNFSDITSKSINAWIKSLEKTKRAKNSYPNCIATVFRAGLLEYNDYDRDIIKIKHQPFMRVEIPKVEKGVKKAVSDEILSKIFNAKISKATRKVTEPLALDVVMLSFCLAGMNTADLYYMKNENLKDWKLTYNRHKTEAEREDNAYFEIKVPKRIRHLFEKYKGANSLFNFSEMYKCNDDFNKYINKGLKDLCKIAEVDDVSTYTFRHSWATIAQNQCGASTELVGFALNHASAHRVTEGYIKKDFSPIDVLNDKVINCVFDK
jgi:site-specific recombinase XerD